MSENNNPNSGTGSPVPEITQTEEGINIFLKWEDLKFIEKIVKIVLQMFRERNTE